MIFLFSMSCSGRVDRGLQPAAMTGEACLAPTVIHTSHFLLHSLLFHLRLSAFMLELLAFILRITLLMVSARLLAVSPRILVLPRGLRVWGAGSF